MQHTGKSEELSKHTRYWILAAILALAAFLRIYQITIYPPGLYADEAMNGSNALEVLETHDIHVFYPENQGREGLYIDVAVPFIYWLGNEAWVLRIPAILFGLATVWGIYLLGTELFSTRVGLLAAFLVATSFWHINFSRIAFRAIAAPCMFTLALWSLLASFRRLREGKAWLPLMLASGVIYGLGFYTYIAYRVTPVLMAGVLAYAAYQFWREGRTRAFVAGALLFITATAITAAPLVVYFWQNPGSFFGRVNQVSVWSGPRPYREVFLNAWRTGRMFFRRGDLNWRHNIAYQRELYWPVSVFFAVGVLLGIVTIYRRLVRGTDGARDSEWRPHLLTLGFLLASAVPEVLSNELVPHALRALLMIPPVFLLGAVGAMRIHRWFESRIPARTLTFLATGLLLGIAYNGYASYFKEWAINTNVPKAFNAPTVAIAREINALPKETAKYVVVFPAGLLVHGVHMPAQPVMFLTRSYTERQQEERNIRYVVAPSPTDFNGYCAEQQRAKPDAKVFCLICESPRCFP
jgi:4-amino-4-deoxy-L-arabinose transferase-like glycosyltransferase